MNYNDDIPIIKTFLFNNKYFLYDANSNVIFEISKELYTELRCLQNCGLSNYLNLNKNTQYYDDMIRLIKKGVVGKLHIDEIEHPETEYIDSLTGRFVNDITFQVTRACNFNCRYCTYANSNQIGRNHEHVNMPIDVARKGLLYLYEHSSDATFVTVGFYGGEPMLNFPLIKEIVEFAETLFYSKKIIYRMTINGSVLTDEMLRFLVEHDFIIVISLDGPEIIQNRHRKFGVSGNGTFDVVYQNVIKIRETYEAYFNQNVSFMSVVFDDEDPRDVLQFYNELKIPDHCVKLMSADLSGVDYTKGDIIVEFNDNPIDKTFYDRMLGIYNSKKAIHPKWHPSGQCIPAVRSLFVNVYGDFYPCEKLIESPSLSIGNINTGLNLQRINELLNIGKLTEQECKHCWALRYCEICIAQCFDVEKGTITLEAKQRACEKQRQKTLYFFRRLIEDKLIQKNGG